MNIEHEVFYREASGRSERKKVGQFSLFGRFLIKTYWLLIKIVNKFPSHYIVDRLKMLLIKFNPALFIMLNAPACVRNLFFKYHVAGFNSSKVIKK